MVRVRFFASLRDLVGESQLDIELERETTARKLFHSLKKRFPELSRYEPIMVVAVNQEYTGWDGRVAPGDEVAFLPPVSGGTP